MNSAVATLKKFIGQELTQLPSPFGNWLKPTLLQVEEGALELSYKVRPEMLNPAQILHGGITAAIADDLMGMTLFTLQKEHFMFTVSLNIDYFYPAKVGEIITAKTKIIKDGKQLVNVECEVFHPNGKLMARAHSNLLNSNTKIPPIPSGGA